MITRAFSEGVGFMVSISSDVALSEQGFKRFRVQSLDSSAAGSKLR
jgi:hypothetical protein